MSSDLVAWLESELADDSQLKLQGYELGYEQAIQNVLDYLQGATVYIDSLDK